MLPVASSQSRTSSGYRWLLAAAALVVVLAGLKAIGHIVTPFLLAGFLTIICAPLLNWMQKHGVPSLVSVLLLFSVVGFTFFLLFLALKGAAESLAVQAPLYQNKLIELAEYFQDMMQGIGLPEEMIPVSIPVPSSAAITGLAKSLAAEIGQFTAKTFFVLLVFMFLLMEGRQLADKLSAAFPGKRRARVRTRKFTRSVYRYILIKTGNSVLTGVLLGSGLAFMRIDFAVLWAILAGVLNFIPTIGSIIAAVPAVIIALITMGPESALLVLVMYIVVNVTIGSIMEPRMMGSSLGISPLVVLISLLLWGYIFGPVGMLLSIPLTMIAKLALEASPSTQWAGILLSDNARKRSIHTNVV